MSFDQANAEFWQEPCGAHLARRLMLHDGTDTLALDRFDAVYMACYPFLQKHIPFDAVRGKDVLEVGLGMGTIGRGLRHCGARYTGLDVARMPAEISAAVQGSILAAPFPDESFDYVISIGCLHHTGDCRKAVAEAHRLLRYGGTLVMMVYNADKGTTIRDWDTSGKLAPFTEFFTEDGVRSLCERFASVKTTLEANGSDIYATAVK